MSVITQHEHIKNCQLFLITPNTCMCLWLGMRRNRVFMFKEWLILSFGNMETKKEQKKEEMISYNSWNPKIFNFIFDIRQFMCSIKNIQILKLDIQKTEILPKT